MIARIRSWLASTLRRSRFERDMADEMALHLSLRADDLVRSGLSRQEADRQARVEFGSREAHREDTRSAKGLALLDAIRGDMIFVGRTLRRHFALSSTIVATLSIAIGISTGVFTLLDAVALRARVNADLRPSFFRVYAAYATDADRFPQLGPVTFANYLAFRRASSVRAMTAWVRFGAPLEASDPQNTRMVAVTCDFFTVYRPPRAVLGRALQADDCTGVQSVVVLSEEVWRGRYTADSGIVGKTVRINDRPLTVIGVLPAFPGQVDRVQAWVPHTIMPTLGLATDLLKHPETIALTIDGVAAAGISRSTVAAEISGIAAQQDRLTPSVRTVTLLTDGSLISAPGAFAQISIVLGLMMTLMVCIVLIACTNVTTLLLSRAEARRQEVAIRLAVGASRARLIRLLLSETIVLAAVAGVVSVWFANKVPDFLIQRIAGRPLEWPLDPDWRVFAWISVVTLISGIVAGLAPTRQALTLSLTDALKTGQALAGAPTAHKRTYHRLIASQLALSFMLVAGALLYRGMNQRLLYTDPGHATQDVLTVRVQDRDRLAKTPAATRLPTLRSQLLAVPGVTHVAYAPALPSASLPLSLGVNVLKTRTAAEPFAVSGDFFSTLGIAIVAGRPLMDAEPACTVAGCPVVISQELARRAFGNANAVGATFQSDSNALFSVVGVAADVTTAGGLDGPLPIVYEPWDAASGRYMAIMRFAGRTAETSAAVSAAVRAAVPDAAVTVLSADASTVFETQAFQQLAFLFSALATLAVTLAMIGVYGVVSYAVKRRSKELGMRIALGAQARDIYMEVARGYRWPVLGGVAIGAVITWPLAAYVQRALAPAAAGNTGPGMPLLDHSGSPYTFLVAGLTMLVVTTLAIAGPARRAAAADPLAALRTD